MKSTDYKRQFIEMLKSAFPDGLPEGANNMSLNVNGSIYLFYFDPDDFVAKKSPRKSTAQKNFVELLDNPDFDLEFLRKFRISIENVEEPKR